MRKVTIKLGCYAGRHDKYDTGIIGLHSCHTQHGHKSLPEKFSNLFLGHSSIVHSPYTDTHIIWHTVESDYIYKCTAQQVAQLLLTNPCDALHYGKQQSLKTFT